MMGSASAYLIGNFSCEIEDQLSLGTPEWVNVAISFKHFSI